MNQYLMKELKSCYRDSGGNRRRFTELVRERTGLLPSGLRRGSVSDLISTLKFKEDR